ncbi:hypothetical protein R2F25_31475 [Streptomyces sp. UP1A-1]|nr:hypothetical protein [Streptomyces sp. UP1A-1]
MLPPLPGGARPLRGGAGEQPRPARRRPGGAGGDRGAVREVPRRPPRAPRLAPGETEPWNLRTVWNLQTVLLRTEREEIPEPWAALSARARLAHLWEAEGTGRWVAVAVADADESDEVQLLAVVTQEAPP